MGVCAYDVVRDISKCSTNDGRMDYVYGVCRDITSDLGRKAVKTLPFYYKDDDVGKCNILLKSEADNPFLLVAHYDAARIDGKSSLAPGANDNGSGVGVCLESLVGLKDLPVDVLFTGAEEVGLCGAYDYMGEVLDSERPRHVLNLDSCGVGRDLYVPEKSFSECNVCDFDFGGILRKSGEKFFSVYDKLLGSPGDHLVFSEYKIPVNVLIVRDKGKACAKLFHTDKDVAENVSADVLRDVSRVVVDSVRKYCDR